MMNKFSVSAILCAAGTSTRMGNKNKLLLPFNGKSIISHCVSQLLVADIDKLIVVLGHQFDELEEEILLFSDHITIVKNEDFRSGHTSSIKRGVQAMHEGHTSFLIGLADMPLITTLHYNQIINHFKKHLSKDSKAIARPKFQETPGHPVILSSYHKEEILGCEDREGCRSVIRSNSDHLYVMKTEEKCYIQDTDTPESYKSLVESNL